MAPEPHYSGEFSIVAATLMELTKTMSEYNSKDLTRFGDKVLLTGDSCNWDRSGLSQSIRL